MMQYIYRSICGKNAAGFPAAWKVCLLFGIFLSFQNFVCLVVIEYFPDHIFIIPEHGLTVVIITPSVTVGLGIAVEHSDAFCLGMDGHKGILLLGGGLGA